MKMVIAALCLVGVSGCANTAEMRTLATETSASVAANQTSLQQFIDAQNELNAANASELSVLSSAAAFETADTQRTLAAWRYAKKQDLIDQEAFAAQVQPSAILSALAASSPSPAQISDGGSVAKLTAASKSFSDLARKPQLIDELKETYASASAVYDALESLKSAANKSTGAAAAKTSAAAAAK